MDERKITLCKIMERLKAKGYHMAFHAETRDGAFIDYAFFGVYDKKHKSVTYFELGEYGSGYEYSRWRLMDPNNKRQMDYPEKINVLTITKAEEIIKISLAMAQKNNKCLSATYNQPFHFFYTGNMGYGTWRAIHQVIYAVAGERERKILDDARYIVLDEYRNGNEVVSIYDSKKNHFQIETHGLAIIG